MNTRINIGSSVTGAVRYVIHEAGRDYATGQFKKAEPGQDRVAWIAGQNLGFEVESREDADLARRVMEYDALHRQSSKTRRIELDCVHITLSWHPDEKPSKGEMIAAAKSALAALGMEKARAIFTSHTDERYAHVHLVASKINPETGLAFDQKENYLKLSKWAQQYEAEHGGVISLTRMRANELRDAIEARDPKAVLEALTARTPTFTERQLDNALAKKIKDVAERVEFREAIMVQPELVRLKDEAGLRLTTRAVLEDEQMLLNAATTLAGANHRIAERHIAAVLRSERFRQQRDAEGKLERGITDEQLSAVRRASGQAGIALISGQAGTGKSYTVDAVRQVHERAGYKVIGLAPTHAVAQDMRAEGFASARTVHSQLMALNNQRQSWDSRTAVIVDEAAMLDTKLMTMLAAHAREAGTKLILVGHDKQLSSITRGGMFSVLAERFGKAELTQVIRQFKADERRASELMAEGNFLDGLGIYHNKKAIQWTRTQEEARAALIKKWAEDSAVEPHKKRFVFAYTNDDVATLNAELRAIRKQRGELGEDHEIATARGQAAFATGDRILFTEMEKTLGVFKGNEATIERIDGNTITAKLDKGGRTVKFDASAFGDFQHGYAGTIYKGQGKTLDRTYLYHTEHWKADAAYVALTRHREGTAIFAATNTTHSGYAQEPWMARSGGAEALGQEDFEAARASFEKRVARGDYHFGFEKYVRYVQDRWAAQERPAQDDHAKHLGALAKQMGRVNENWGASTYELEEGQEPVKVPYWLTAQDLLARWSARDEQAIEPIAKPEAQVQQPQVQPAQEPARAAAPRPAPEARPAARSPAEAPPEAAQQAAANENEPASEKAAPKVRWWRRLFRVRPEEQPQPPKPEPARPTPIVDQWVAAEVEQAARARAAQESRPPEEQGQRQTGDAMVPSAKATTGTLEERRARLREEMAAWRAELTRQRQENQAALRRLEIEERQLELRRQAREREPLSTEERDRQLMIELQLSASPSIAVDWVKARAAIAQRPELFEEVRSWTRLVGSREAAERLPAIMARLEPQRPRQAPRQDDDDRPRPGPAPRMRFDPW